MVKMQTLILASIKSPLRENVMEMCKSLDIQCKFLDEIKDWNQFETILIDHRQLKHLDEIVPKMKKLSFIQTLSAGVDKVDFSSVPENVTLCSNAGAYSEPVAEHAVSMALTLSKNLLYNHVRMRDGIFDQRTENKVLKGSKVGIIGYGGIGREIGEISKNLGMKVFAISRNPVKDTVEFSGTLDSLDFVLSQCDIIFISIPLNKFTRDLINKDKLNKMKKDAILVNVARADIINERDLYEHLKENPEFKAGIDTWWSEPTSYDQFQMKYPFLDLNNILGSPHNSGIVNGEVVIAYKNALNNIKKWGNGLKPDNIVKAEDYL
jgi:glycerate dehydrogenase